MSTRHACRFGILWHGKSCVNEFERIIISSSPKTGLLESNISSDVTHCSKEAGLRPSMERARLESFQVTQCLRPTVRQISNSFRHQHTRKIFLTNTMSHVPSSSGQYRNRPTLMKSSMAMPTGGPSLFASQCPFAAYPELSDIVVYGRGPWRMSSDRRLRIQRLNSWKNAS